MGNFCEKNDTKTEEKTAVSISGRPQVLPGYTYKMQTGCGPLYVTINYDQKYHSEIFLHIGKSGGCAASQSEAIGRLVSLAWRSDIPIQQIIKQLRGISCHSPYGLGENKVTSCADAVAIALQTQLTSNVDKPRFEKIVSVRGACPDCGSPLQPGKCNLCRFCGYEECR